MINESNALTRHSNILDGWMNESEKGSGTQAKMEDDFNFKHSELMWRVRLKWDLAGVGWKFNTLRDT